MVAFNRRHFRRTDCSASTANVDHAAAILSIPNRPVFNKVDRLDLSRALSTFAGVSGAPCFVGGTDEVFAVVLANLQQLAAGKLRACPIAAVTGLKHQAWEAVVRKIQKRSESLSPHYDPELYVKRSLESEIEKFIASDRSMMLVIGESGLGKSTLLERIRTQSFEKGDICLALASHRLPAPVDEVERFVIQEIAGERSSEGSAYWSALDREAHAVGRHVVIIIDAVNEYNGGAGGAAPAPIDFLVKLDQLASRTRSARLLRIKYIVSCRSELWRRGGSDRVRASQTGGAYYATNGQIAHTLGRYSDEEALDAYNRYHQRYGIRTPGARLSPLTRYYLRDPLLLRLACKVHENGEIPHELDTSALFKSYAEHVGQSEAAANTLQLMIEDMFTSDSGGPGLVMTRDAIQRNPALMRRNKTLYDELDARDRAGGGTALRELNVIRQDGSIRFTYDRFAQYLLSEYLVQRISEQATTGGPARTVDEVAFEVLKANLDNGRQLVTTASVLRRTLRRLHQLTDDFPGLVASVAQTGEPGLALVVSVMAAIASRSTDGIQVVETLLQRLGTEPSHSGRRGFPVVDAIYQMLLDEEYSTWLNGQPADLRADHLVRLHTRFADCLCSADPSVSTPAIQYSFFLWQNTAARPHAQAVADISLERVPSLLRQGFNAAAAKLGFPTDPQKHWAALVNLSVLIELTLAESRDAGVLELAREMSTRLGLGGFEGRILAELSGRIVQILGGLENGITWEDLKLVFARPAARVALSEALLMLRAPDTDLDYDRVRRLGASANGYVLQILSFALSVRYERARSEAKRVTHIAALGALFCEPDISPGLRYAIALALYHINYFGDAASQESMLLMQRVAAPLLHDHKGHFRLGDRRVSYNIIGTLGRALRKNGHLVDNGTVVAAQPALQYALDAIETAKTEGDSKHYRYVCDSVGLLGVLVDPRDVLEIVELILADLSTLQTTPGFDANEVAGIRRALLCSLANMRVLYRIEVDRYLLDVLDDYPLYLEVSEIVPQFKLSDFQSWTAEQLVFRFLTRYYAGFGTMFIEAALRAVDKTNAADAVREVMSSILEWVSKASV